MASSDFISIPSEIKSVNLLNINGGENRLEFMLAYKLTVEIRLKVLIHSY